MAFAPSDLLVSQRELDTITASLANQGIVDPISKEISAAVQTVESYTSGYTVDSERKNEWIRTIALYKLYALLNRPANPREAAYKETMQELRDFRDGKFQGATPSTGNGGAKWGGNTKI